MAHTPNGFRLGDENLFIKGVVEAVVTNPVTGDIIGYDNVASEGSVTTSVNMGEITGGVGNPLLITLPDTTRISGTLTSQAFSLRQRALTVGSEVAYGGVVQKCLASVAPVGTKLYIPATATQPAKSYAQGVSDDYGICYVREHNAAQYEGTNYGVSLTVGSNGYEIGVENAFTAQAGKTYDIFYFASVPSAEVLPLQTQFAPSVASISLKYCIFAKQNGSVKNGTLHGYLYFIVPRAQFTGDAGISASQTENSTTAYDWTALMPDSNMIDCAECGTSDSNYAYYVYVPCGNATQSVRDLVIPGGGISIVGATSKQIPVLYLMPNGETITPTYTDLEYEVTTGSNVSVDEKGLVTASANGDAEITVTLEREDADDLVTYCNVSVSGIV